MTQIEQGAGVAGPKAWLVEWHPGDGNAWEQAYVSEVPARDQARTKGGTCTPLYAAPAPSLSEACETLRNAILAGKVLAIGMAHGLASLAKERVQSEFSSESAAPPAAPAAPVAQPGTEGQRELDLYDEIECDLPYLFGRASKEGHEAGQRLAEQVKAKMQRARALNERVYCGGDPQSPRVSFDAAPVAQLSEHDAESLRMIAAWMDRDGVPDAAALLRRLAKAPSASAPSASPAVAQLLAAAEEALAVIPKIKPLGNGNGTEIRLRAAIDAARTLPPADQVGDARDSRYEELFAKYHEACADAARNEHDATRYRAWRTAICEERWDVLDAMEQYVTDKGVDPLTAPFVDEAADLAIATLRSSKAGA